MCIVHSISEDPYFSVLGLYEKYFHHGCTVYITEALLVFCEDCIVFYRLESPLKVKGQLVTDPKLQAEVLDDQFQAVFSEGWLYSQDEF